MPPGDRKGASGKCDEEMQMRAWAFRVLSLRVPRELAELAAIARPGARTFRRTVTIGNVAFSKE